MKTKMQEVIPWLSWAWCFSHRLELACKDAFTSSLFSEIDEMLLCLFYLYSNSPKKSKELDIIAGELTEVYELPKKGNLHVRCQGTRWIGHKRRALQRIVDRFGVYIIHLTNLIEDPADKCKLKGYLLKWSQGKMLIGLFNVY